jgi:hypothetical protein
MMSQMAPQGQGIAAGADVQMAEGGIVGYAGPEGSLVTPRTYGYAPDYQDARRMGINLSPYDSPEVRREKLERLQKMREFEASPDRGTAIPTEASQANEQALAEAFSPAAQERRMQDVVPRPTPQFTVGNAPRPPALRPPAPAPEKRKQPAETGIAATMLPDTRESTAVNPSEAALLNAQMQGRLNDLRESLSRKPAESEAEKAYRAAAMAEYQRGLGGIDAARQRMAESQKKQKDMDFINYLSGMGGGRSLFAGMQKSGQALSQAQQQREASRLAYEDKLEDRRNIVENLKLATLRQDAESARAWTNELRKNEVEISKLSIDLSKDRAGQLAITEREREKTAATARENALDRTSLERRAAADRAAQAALRNLPSADQQMAERVMKDYMAKNPGSTLSDAWDFYRGAGRPTDRAVLTFAQAAKNVDERLSNYETRMALNKEEAARAKIEKRAPRTLAQMREELIREEMSMAGRFAGSAPTAEPSATTQLPSGVKVTRVGP